MNSTLLNGSVELQNFLQTSLDRHVQDILRQSDLTWSTRLAEYVRRTPAYSKFLAENPGDPAPVTTKANYIYEYPLAERCLDGKLAAADIFSVSSGTTASPVLWPRSLADEARAGFVFEHVFRESFRCLEYKTLAIICFPLGVWVGGIHTLSSIRLLALKGYPVTVLAPGTNFDELKRCLAETLPAFEQVVLCGYPPFLRDVVDDLVPDLVDPYKVRIRLLLAGEAVSESWRDSMTQRVTRDPEGGVISLYGTADAGPLAFETVSTIRFRRMLDSQPDVVKPITGLDSLPSVFQYLPDRIRFEENTESVIMSVQSTHPLFRYTIGDLGSAHSAAGLEKRIGAPTEASSLPFVLHSGRADQTVAFFGGKIYPEHAAELLDRLEYREKITGRFMMVVRHSAEQNERLTIVVEARAGIEPDETFLGALEEALEAHLLVRNSEYANYVPSRYKRPKVASRPFMDKEYFERGRKQVYIRGPR